MTTGVSIVGAAESAFGKLPDMSELALHAEAARKALADAGIDKSEVDGVFAVTQDLNRCPSLLVSEYLGIRPRYEDSSSTGGSVFEVLLDHAVGALLTGKCDVALITYGSKMLTDFGRSLGTGIAPYSHIAQQYEEPFGLNTVASYALAARRHMHEFGTTSEQLAQIAVSARAHAGLNPLALHRDPITIEDVMSSRMIADPLHKLDCCVITDGGGAIVLTRDDRAADTRRPVPVLGSAHASSHMHIAQMPDLVRTAAADTGARAFAEAGITPADVDVLQTYDSFTITVLLALEDLGFAPKGEGGRFVMDHGIELGGALPVNTDGGGLSSNHPGMRGLFLLIESVRQLRGEAGDAQVAGAEIGVAHGVGGWLSSHGTIVMGAAR